MAGHGGGAWKVAYADFVTAMMAFFLVMWIVAQSEQMKEAIAHHFNDPFAKESDEDGTVHQRPPKHPAPARITDRPEHEKEAGGSHSVLLTTQGGERTSIGTVLHFTDDSAELDGEARRRLCPRRSLPAQRDDRGQSRPAWWNHQGACQGDRDPSRAPTRPIQTASFARRKVLRSQRAKRRQTGR